MNLSSQVTLLSDAPFTPQSTPSLAHSPACSYLVGVYDNNGQLTLYPTSLLTVTKLSTSETPSQKIGEKNMLAREELGNAFGSRKMKASIRAKEANALDIAGIMESTGQAIRAGIPVVAEVREEVGERPHIPPFNILAEKAEDVYKIDDIAPAEHLANLPVGAFLQCKDKTGLLVICKAAFVNERMIPALHNRNEEKVKRLAYLLYMIQFYKMSPFAIAAALTKRRKTIMIPGFLIEHFANMFMEKSIEVGTGNTKLLMSEVSKSKCLHYILALAMMESTNYRVSDVSLLAADLAMSRKKCIDGFKEIGCKVDGNQKKGVIMALPLSFPKKTRQ